MDLTDEFIAYRQQLPEGTYDKSGMRTVVAAMVALSPKPDGFATADPALRIQEMAGRKPEHSLRA